MAVAIVLKHYYFRIIIKNLTKCNILSTFALKNYVKFTDHNLGKLCPQSFTSRGSVLEKLVLGLGLGFFLSPWPQTLCPRLHLWSYRTQCYHRLATAAAFRQKKLCCPGSMTQRCATPTDYTLRRNAASIMKDLI